MILLNGPDAQLVWFGCACDKGGEGSPSWITEYSMSLFANRAW